MSEIPNSLFSRGVPVENKRYFDVTIWERTPEIIQVSSMGLGGHGVSQVTIDQLDELIDVLKQARRAIRHAQWKAKPTYQQEVDSTVERLRSSKAEEENKCHPFQRSTIHPDLCGLCGMPSAHLNHVPEIFEPTTEYRLVLQHNGAVRSLERKWVGHVGTEDWRPVEGRRVPHVRERQRDAERVEPAKDAGDRIGYSSSPEAD